MPRSGRATKALGGEPADPERRNKGWDASHFGDKGKPFALGVSGNPGGRPLGSRNRLQGDFFKALAEDFAAHGQGAIVSCREKAPDRYLTIIGQLMPKQIEVERPLDKLTDAELDEHIAAVTAMLADRSAAAGEPGAGPRPVPRRAARGKGAA